MVPPRLQNVFEFVHEDPELRRSNNDVVACISAPHVLLAWSRLDTQEETRRMNLLEWQDNDGEPAKMELRAVWEIHARRCREPPRHGTARKQQEPKKKRAFRSHRALLPIYRPGSAPGRSW